MWHVLHTAPQAEPQVCKFLAVQGLDTYAPQFLPPTRTKRGSVRDRRRRWVFPGYLFLKVPDGFMQWDVIRWAPGVRRLLQEEGAPAVLADSIIEHLRLRLAENRFSTPRQTFHPGQRVLIERGPLAAVDAIFDSELDARARVRVLVQLLGRQVAVEIDPAALRPAG
jgi:transcription antitermination factor NusG